MVETEDKKKMIEILKRDKEEREQDFLPEELLGDEEDEGNFEGENVEELLAQLSNEEREMFEKAVAGKAFSKPVLYNFCRKNSETKLSLLKLKLNILAYAEF